uniref:Uncharacterized protein n=1 Tax=Avena sativa TaxID=4498 RepID=A0ACD5VNI5_AVESA
MARKKVTLQYIPNDSTRRGTFKKRRRGLMKKAGELSILCDVKACLVVYSEGESVPEVFPSHPEALVILNHFKNMPELDQCKKMMNQEGFIRQRIEKLRDQVHKSGRDCRDREIKFLLHKAMMGNLPDLEGLSIEELTSVGWKVEVLLKSIGDRITKIRGYRSLYQQPSCHGKPSPDPYLVGGMDMRDPAMYQAQAPPLQERWLDMVRSGGSDLSAVVYSGSNGSHDGVGTSASDDVVQPFDMGAGFACQWAANPAPSPSSFPPMSAGRG